MEPDGIQNVWSTNARTATAISTATTTRTGISRQIALRCGRGGSLGLVVAGRSRVWVTQEAYVVIPDGMQYDDHDLSPGGSRVSSP
jgi:hypothetical protein